MCAAQDDSWPFDQAANVAAITTVNVIDHGAPILVVIHYDDDESWAFLCGTTNDDRDGRVIGMGEVLRIDPTLRAVADLAPGWKAWRSGIGEEWQRVPNPDE
jgi:hypothetical protein